jgi:hypothetical protein
MNRLSGLKTNVIIPQTLNIVKEESQEDGDIVDNLPYIYINFTKNLDITRFSCILNELPVSSWELSLNRGKGSAKAIR